MKPTKFEPFGAFIFHNTGSSWISSFPSALNLLNLIILILNTGTWSNPIYVTPEFDIFDHLMAPRANTQPSTSHVSNLNSPYSSHVKYKKKQNLAERRGIQPRHSDVLDNSGKSEGQKPNS